MRDSNPTRRNVLRLLAVSGVGSLAGCPGSSSDDTAVTPVRVPTETAPVRTPAGTPDARAPGSTLSANDADGSDEFGEAIAVSGDGTIALVGAPADEDPNGSLAGSAYVFEDTGGSWRQGAKLVADDGDSFDSFGRSVAVSETADTALVGAPADEDPNGRLGGSAYVFGRRGGTWTQQGKLTPDDGSRLDRFGWTIGLSGDGSTAVVGTYSDTAGSASVFGDHMLSSASSIPRLGLCSTFCSAFRRQ